MTTMTIEPVAVFRSPLTEKFGVPRQSGLAPNLRGRIVFAEKYSDANALRGIEGFDWLWLIWSFSKNVKAEKRALVRPPRLGGNTQMGVFATRSSFRPNNLALSSVKIEEVRLSGKTPEIIVSGADLMDGTPIYDIKPYIPYCDSHPDARAGFTDTNEWTTLEISIDESLRRQALARLAAPEQYEALLEVLRQDPRPQYHSDPERVYGLAFGGLNVRFRIADGMLTVVEIN